MNKDPLDYNEKELRSLPIDELKELYIETERLESRWNTRQLVSKTLINSLYGCLANKWFALFNEEMSAAITANGRFFIRKLANYIEDTLQKILPQEKKYIVYGDTDSCIGDTEISIDNMYSIEIKDKIYYVTNETMFIVNSNIVTFKSINENDIIEEIIYENGKQIKLK